MHKVYLLLRNNQQTGPYSFEELLALHLKPFDLVWVEGKSYGWRYPTEVESLKHHFISNDDHSNKEDAKPAAEPKSTSTKSEPSAKNIFVSMPSNSNRVIPAGNTIDAIEQKAEELRKRAEAYIPKQEPVKTNLNRHLDEVEEDYTKWMFQKKTNKMLLPGKRFAAVATVCIGLLVGGWWAYTKFFNTDTSSPTIALTSPTGSNIEKKSNEEEILNLDSTGSKMQPSIPAETIQKENRKKEVTAFPIEKKQVSDAEPVDKNEIQKETNEKIIEEPVLEDQKETATNEAATEKKKTIKEKINDLFKKKTTGEGTEAEPKSTENSTNERKATRRENETETNDALTDISKEVEIKTNKLADSWMLGVKNLKLTLFNRSTLTVNSAKVEVQYFSDNNELLETKTFSFSNIPPKKSQTLAVPDQRLADHIEYKVLSAMGMEKAFANR